MTDQDPMPFGKYSKEPDGPKTMAEVPASYLLWLRDQGCSHPQVKEYIEENLTALYKECPDYIPEDER